LIAAADTPPAPLIAPAAQPAYFNPVYGRVFPDPGVMRVGRLYYAYGTTTGNRKRDLFPVLRSRDLVHWRKLGYAMRRPPRWSHAHWWAPSPLKRGKRYYLFYSAKARRPNKMCVAVAVARHPQGPFHHRARLACAGAGGALDPAPMAVGRRVYLYFARTDAFCRTFPGRCSIAGMRLSRNLLHARARPRRLLGIDQPWESSRRYAAVENPFVFKRGPRFYLLYSANDWRRAYGMGYAVSRSPLGPFTKPESRPFLRARRGIFGPGGGSAVVGPRGQLWLVYHARRQGVGFVPDRRRSLNIDRLMVGGGRVRVMGPSFGSAVRP
jgi:beta-xylosidase